MLTRRSKMKKCNLWCVRAGSGGKYTESFIKGNYFAIGWNKLGDLSTIKNKSELYLLYEKEYPNDGKIVTGQQVGQIARFLLQIQPGDYVITPSSDTEKLLYGKVKSDPYYYQSGDDGGPCRHRRSITWNKKGLNRGDFSVPFQSTIRSALTVFSISQSDEFLKAIGHIDSVLKTEKQEQYNSYHVVLNQILELNPKEFEELVSHLLAALGFEDTEVTGKPHDGGVDVTGVLSVSNLVKIKVFGQVKRYKLGATIDANTVKKLRSSIPRDAQGVFITTASYQKKAREVVALDRDFPRIGLVNGHQLVDLLVEHWEDIPEKFQEKLGLRPGLVHA